MARRRIAVRANTLLREFAEGRSMLGLARKYGLTRVEVSARIRRRISLNLNHRRCR